MAVSTCSPQGVAQTVVHCIDGVRCDEYAGPGVCRLHEAPLTNLPPEQVSLLLQAHPQPITPKYVHSVHVTCVAEEGPERAKSMGISRVALVLIE